MIRLLLAAIAIVLYSGFVFSGEKGKKEPGGGRLEELFHGAVDF